MRSIRLPALVLCAASAAMPVLAQQDPRTPVPHADLEEWVANRLQLCAAAQVKDGLKRPQAVAFCKCANADDFIAVRAIRTVADRDRFTEASRVWRELYDNHDPKVRAEAQARYDRCESLRK